MTFCSSKVHSICGCAPGGFLFGCIYPIPRMNSNSYSLLIALATMEWFSSSCISEVIVIPLSHILNSYLLHLHQTLILLLLI